MALGLAGLRPVVAHATEGEGEGEGGGEGAAVLDEDVVGMEIVVEGQDTTTRADPQNTSMAVTVIEVGEELSASADVASVVDSVPGTTVQRLGGLGDYAAVSVRGADVRNTKVCLDGIPLNPDGASAVNLSELPLWAFERVEIYRGNAPARLGATAMGGVINLVTGDVDQGAYGGSVSHGSFTTNRLLGTARIPGRVGDARTGTLLVAEGFSTRGDYRYFADNGTEYNLLDDHVLSRSNNDKTQLNVHGLWSAQGDAWKLSLLDAFLSREEGLGGHVNSPTQTVRLATTRNLAAVQLEGHGDRLRGEVRTWGLFRREELDDQDGEIGTGSQHQADRTSAVGVLGHGRWAPVNAVIPSLTVSARRDAFVRADLLTEQTDAARSRVSLSGAVGVDLHLFGERLTLSPVFQLTWLDNRALVLQEAGDNTQTINGEPRDNELLPAPRGGLLLRPTDWLSAKANLAWGYRPPDFTELFGDRGAIVGNPSLGPEKGLQGDLGLRIALPDHGGLPEGSVEGGVYANRMSDQIVFVQNAQRTQVPVNLENTRARGVEAAVILRWWGWLETRSNLTRNWSENLSSDPAEAGNQLPRTPNWEVYQGTAFVRGDWLRVGHSYSYTDGNYWDRTNYYRAAPRHFHGLFARVQPGPKAPSVELSVMNLLDRTVQVVPRNPLDPTGADLVVQPITDFVGYPLPGRTVLFTLRWAHSPNKDT